MYLSNSQKSGVHRLKRKKIFENVLGTGNLLQIVENRLERSRTAWSRLLETGIRSLDTRFLLTGYNRKDNHHVIDILSSS